MRHYFALRPIPPRPLGVCQPAPAAGLVADTGLALRQITGLLRAVRSAVALAAIATAAQQHLHAAACTHIQSSGFQRHASVESRSALDAHASTLA